MNLMFYRPYGNSTTGTVKEIIFTEVTVQGGGILEIDSGGDGMKLIGTKIHVESGGIIVADFLDIVVSELVVDDSGQIHTNYKVAVTLLDIQMNLVISISDMSNSLVKRARLQCNSSWA
jgi:hypothetical protein